MDAQKGGEWALEKSPQMVDLTTRALTAAAPSTFPQIGRRKQTAKTVLTLP